jgi:hypothetical protein
VVGKDCGGAQLTHLGFLLSGDAEGLAIQFLSGFGMASPPSEVRHDLSRKQGHRLLYERGVHQPSLVEVPDELVKTILGLQLPTRAMQYSGSPNTPISRSTSA